MKKMLMIIALVFTFSNKSYADTCYQECVQFNPDGSCQQYQQLCLPEYGVWQYTEPDWCLYSTGDKVDVQSELVGPPTGFQHVAWYVVPLGDPAGNNFTYTVTDCDYTIIP